MKKINVLCSQICFCGLGGNSLTLIRCEKVIHVSLSERRRRLFSKLDILFDFILYDLHE